MKMFAHGQKAEKEEEDQLVQEIGPEVDGLQCGLGQVGQQAGGQPAGRYRGPRDAAWTTLLRLGGRTRLPSKSMSQVTRPMIRANDQDRLPGVILAAILGGTAIALGREHPPAHHGHQSGRQHQRGGDILEHVVNRTRKRRPAREA